MSTISLRKYQTELKRLIYAAWLSGTRNVLAVLPTGAGKTVTFADIVFEHIASIVLEYLTTWTRRGAVCVIAHRQELVTQISLALARDSIKHRIVGPPDVVKLAVRIQRRELGRDFYDPGARVGVAGVDTLIRPGRQKSINQWLQSVTLWIQDEAHHVLRDNKWGKAAALFPNAIGLGVTATPGRADGTGLGRHADGIFDDMVVGPSMRELIDWGYLTDYRIAIPQSDYVRPEKVGGSGDFTQATLVNAARGSHIVGDVVAEYLKFAPGKLGVTFVESIETAERVAAEFNRRGVPAASLSSKTPAPERIAKVEQFRRRELLQLVNCDLFGEGFDLPAIEVVSMARATESFGLYVQQFGRALRLMLPSELGVIWESLTPERRLAELAQSVKPHAMIIDHVGNVIRHGLPDAPRAWSLDRREKRARSEPDDAIPLRGCPECGLAYERFHPACPHCGFKPKPVARSGPEYVDGDLIELDADVLAQMRGAIAVMDKSAEDYAAELAARRVPLIGQIGHVNRHLRNQEAQAALRASIAWWAGYQRAAGRSDSESYRRFYFAFGLDVLTAQALKRDEALALADRINARLAVSDERR